MSRVRTLASAALLVTVVTLASRIVGFGRWLAQGAWLGSDGVGTVFNSANQLPNLLFEVAAGGALAGAVVPLLAGPLSRAAFSSDGTDASKEQASRIASALLGWTLVVLVPLAGLMALLARPIIGLTGLTDPVHVDVATAFLRVFAVQVPLYGLAVVLGGILQAHKRFFWPSFAPLVSSLVVIVVYAVFGALANGDQQDVAALSGRALVWLAWGTTAGVLFLALPLVVPVRRTGLRLRPTLRFPSGEGPRAARLAFAGVGALVVQQLSVFLTLRAANAAGGDGTLSVYLYAQQVYLLPYAVLAFPIATSAFPHFAEHASAGRLDELRALVARTTRSLLLVTAAGMAALMAAAPFVERVFDLIVRGDAPGLAVGLVFLAPGLIGFALILHLSRALYAVDHGRAAVIATASGWGVSAIGAAFVPLFFAGRSPGRDCATPACSDLALRADVMAGLGAVGTAGMIVAGLGLLLAVRRHLGPDALSGVWRALLVLVVAAGAGAAVGWLVPASLSRQKFPFRWSEFSHRSEVPFDGGAFAAQLGLGLAVGLLAAFVTLVIAVLLDRDLRSAVGPRLGGLRRKISRKA
ncbi:murein biosynthesis integral membrane protein MurJ [Promicromonospora iranensis]|uniref:Peptidoglycan lipid II flippase n=1 Tax=Promicromonospora iranensis TaxID=1105144 RepID=A0ABU2CJ02_9MICO|nr:lipid II flippase MurJ [Promicromonospora iranensis]MDR7381292.1 putative peptidoglycan lipid II flippase [Promicromonospora iranensis]